MSKGVKSLENEIMKKGYKFIFSILPGFLAIILLTILVIVALLGFHAYRTRGLYPRDYDNPLRKLPEEIKIIFLEFTPVGTSMEDVLYVIKDNEEWESGYVNDKQGYTVFRGRVGDYIPNDLESYFVGVKSIRATVGTYYNGYLLTHVEIFWGFDEDSNLVDLDVRKTTDNF